MHTSFFVALAVLVVAGGCGVLPRETPSHGSSHTVRAQQPPDRAAACFARNAEEHSSALVAEVTPRGDAAEVVVRVKNGVVYGTAEFRRAGSGSTGRLMLNVSTTGSRGDLVDALLEGC